MSKSQMTMPVDELIEKVIHNEHLAKLLKEQAQQEHVSEDLPDTDEKTPEAPFDNMPV